MKKLNGFSLLELIIVLVVISILTILAIILYSSQIRQVRRADGIDSLNSLSLAEERYRTSNLQYGTLAQVWNGVTTSTGGYYTLSISGTSATGYTLTATAVGNQANDTDGSTSCATLQITVSNGTVTRTPSICWPQ